MKGVCVCVGVRQVRSLTLIGRRAQQECGWLQLSMGQVQTALSSHERVIVTGKSLHDQREAGLCQICTALENIVERRRSAAARERRRERWIINTEKAEEFQIRYTFGHPRFYTSNPNFYRQPSNRSEPPRNHKRLSFPLTASQLKPTPCLAR